MNPNPEHAYPHYFIYSLTSLFPRAKSKLQPEKQPTYISLPFQQQLSSRESIDIWCPLVFHLSHSRTTPVKMIFFSPLARGVASREHLLSMAKPIRFHSRTTKRSKTLKEAHLPRAVRHSNPISQIYHGYDSQENYQIVSANVLIQSKNSRHKPSQVAAASYHLSREIKLQ